MISVDLHGGLDQWFYATVWCNRARFAGVLYSLTKFSCVPSFYLIIAEHDIVKALVPTKPCAGSGTRRGCRRTPRRLYERGIDLALDASRGTNLPSVLMANPHRQ